jgi:ribosomal-protein-alanine N-acetyltransferase
MGPVAQPAFEIRELSPLDLPGLAELLAWAPEAASWVEGYPGYVALEHSPAGPIYRGFLLFRVVAGEGEILNLAIAPACRRQGLARRLFEKVLPLAATWHLEVRASNRAAITLYESLGFTNAGRRERYYLDGEAALLFTKQGPQSGFC